MSELLIQCFPFIINFEYSCRGLKRINLLRNIRCVSSWMAPCIEGNITAFYLRILAVNLFIDAFSAA
jgi:hypothetical protein